MSDPTARLLARHAVRRRQGLATVSVLTGRPSATAAAWTAAAGVPVLPIDPAAAPDAASLGHAVVTAARVRCGLLAAAIADLSRRTGRPPGCVLAGRSLHDLEHLWRAIPVADDDLLALVRTICTRPIDDWPADLATRLPDWRAIVAIDRLLVGGPAVWVAAPPTAGWLATAAGPLAALAAAVPRWPVGVGVSPEAFAAYAFAAAGDARADVVICGGRVPVPDDGPPPTTPPPPTPDTAEDDDPARSAAERALFDLLNLKWPGLFVLNHRLPFPFGPRPAEADLYAASLRLAIEVDGCHHFQDPARYRLDRRKDWAYHAHGHRVVRVLAEDVLARPVEILDGLRPVVDHCRRHPMGVGPTGRP